MALQAGAVMAAERHPLDYSLKEYGFLLGLALLGGLVSWVQKVRAGTVQAWNLMSLVGELATSAFAGLVTFFVCEYMNMPAPLTAAIVGVSGHMGVRAIGLLEKMAEKRLGVSHEPTEPRQ
jgi:hypothetical protein